MLGNVRIDKMELRLNLWRVILVVYLERVILSAVVLLVVALITPLDIPRGEIMIGTGNQALNHLSCSNPHIR